MSTERSQPRFVPSWARHLPVDLLVAVATVFGMGVVLAVPILRTSVLRPMFALPSLLFVPGYVLIAALYPERSRPETTVPPDATRRPLDAIERVALSGVMSPVVVVVVAFVLNFTRWGFRTAPILAALSVTVTVLAAIAWWRRAQLSPDRRPSFVAGSRIRTWLHGVRSPESSADLLLNLAVALALVTALASVGFAIENGSSGDAYTELQLLTATPEGDLIATDPPRELTTGTNESIIVGVHNHEYEPTDYTLVVQLQRTEMANGSVRVLEREQVDRAQITLGHNETWLSNRTFTPMLTGERLRLVFFLYRGAPPINPTEDSTYRWAHLWVDVRESLADQTRSDRR